MSLSGLKRLFINKIIIIQPFIFSWRRPVTLSVPQCRCWSWPDSSLCPRSASSSSSTRATDGWRRRRRRFTGPTRAAALQTHDERPTEGIPPALRDLEISSLSIPFFRMIVGLSLSPAAWTGFRDLGGLGGRTGEDLTTFVLHHLGPVSLFGT